MKAVEEYAGEGQLSWPGQDGRPVGYQLTRYQGLAGNGMPVPGLFRIDGAIDLRGEAVPEFVLHYPVTLRLADGRSLSVTLTTVDGQVHSEGHGPSRCLCC